MATIVNSKVSKLMSVRNVCIFGEDIAIGFRRYPKTVEVHLRKSRLFSSASMKTTPVCNVHHFHPVCRNHKLVDSWTKSSHIISSIYFYSARFQSTTQNVEQSNQPAGTTSEPSVDFIPEPPPVPTVPESISSVQDISSVVELVDGVEPSLAELGLGGWTPVGLVQNALEFLHISCNMPWWLSIAIGTLVVRLCLFPLVIYSQRNSAHLNNNLPQMQLLQLKMAEARKSGNAIDAARYGHELLTFMKTKSINPMKNMFVPLMQAPVFVSIFLGLRKMANLPVESLKSGGIFWFTNLTISDPLYLLPLITSATLYLTIELGVDGGIRSDSLQMTRYIIRAVPLVILPFIINFPSCILCYWATSNFISLGQVALLRLEPVRTYFNIPKLVHHTEVDLPMKKKGFVEGFKDAFTNAKVSRNLEDRYRMDEVRFRKAGLGPIQKTYNYDPTKQKPINASASEHSRYKT